MDRSGVEIVTGMYDAFHGGSVDRALAHFDPEVVVDLTVRVDGGIGHGREELSAMIGQWISSFEGWREEIEEIREAGDSVYVVATQHGRGKESGVETKTRYALVYDVRDGLITGVKLYASPEQAERDVR